MKFETQALADIQRGDNLGEDGSFTIKLTAKAFKSIADGLYTNKYLAVIRELTCNAIDAHAEAGKSATPIEVHLPNELEPFFSVKDNGTGLSDEFMKKRYTAVFDSTKNDNNLTIGGFGVGRLSSLSYTNSYMVTSRHGGFKRVYTVFYNEQNMPTISMLDESEHTGDNGFEVTIAVKNSDIWSFTQNARDFFSRGLVNATFNGGTAEQAGIPPMQYGELQGTGWSLRASGGAFVIMGAVSYPLRETPDMQLSSAEQALIKCPLDITVPIGDIEVVMSREALQMTPKSSAFIKEVLGKIIVEISTVVSTKIASAKNLWDAAAAYKSLQRGGLNSVWRAIGSVPCLWNGKDVRALDGKLPIGADLVTYTWSDYRKKMSSYTSCDLTIGVDEVIFLDDEVATDKRARHYLKSVGGNGSLNVIRPNGVSRADIITALGKDGDDFPNFSDRCPPIPKTPRTLSEKGKASVLEFTGGNDVGAAQWDVDEDFDIEDGGVYVPIDAYRPVGASNGTQAKQYWRSLNQLFVQLGETTPPLVGVKSRALSKFVNHPKWKSITTYLQELIDSKFKDTSWLGAKLDCSEYQQIADNYDYSQLIDWLGETVKQSWPAAPAVIDCAGLLKKAAAIKSTDFSLSEFCNRASLWGCTTPAVKATLGLQNAIAELYKNWPLLGVIRRTSVETSLRRELAAYTLLKK